MTDQFEKDESTDIEECFAIDDQKYENSKPDDGSRFRQRGHFGLRGRGMHRQLLRLMAQ